MKIFLIGFMGSGKTYLGKQLASKLGFLFVDVDSVIENTEGVKIAQLFDSQGETYFRKIESDRLKALAKWDEVIVSTGGGAPCFHDNMDWMNTHGITVYLQTDPNLLLNRLKSETENRPLLRGKTDEELLDFIKNKIADRKPFYEKAKIIVAQNEDGDEIIFDILKKILDSRSSN
jgi:shikimate kinase